MKQEENQAQSMQTEFQKIVEASLAVMKNLASVLDRETNLVGKKDAGDMTALRSEKAKLIRDYRANMMILIQNPDLLKGLADAVRAQLKAVGEVLAEATKRNLETLKTAVDATQSLVSTIMSAAKRETRSHDSYGNPNQKRIEKSAYGVLQDPVAVSRTV